MSPEPELTAKAFLAALDEHRGDSKLKMGKIFAVAKQFTDMPLDQVEVLLDEDAHEARVGAVSIMDFQARRKRTGPERREELFALYLRRHDRINTWDLVDRAAPHVVGGHLDDKPRDVLYELARSEVEWERRTAIVATWFFIRQDDTADTFALAEILVDAPEHLMQRAVGSWVRAAGQRDPDRLTAFLDAHAATMPRTALRLAVEKLGAAERAHYMAMAGK